jgi:hypothetical protein
VSGYIAFPQAGCLSRQALQGRENTEASEHLTRGRPKTRGPEDYEKQWGYYCIGLHCGKSVIRNRGRYLPVDFPSRKASSTDLLRISDAPAGFVRQRRGQASLASNARKLRMQSQPPQVARRVDCVAVNRRC